MAVRTDRFIFYHVPKTGGTWVKAALRNAGLVCRATPNLPGPHPFNLKIAHATPDVVPERHRAGLYSVAFVRHPVGWYRSFWAYVMREGARRDKRFPANSFLDGCFDAFVNKVLDAYPDGFVTQLYQYYTGADCEKLDFVGRNEYLIFDLLWALGRAGERVDAERLLQTPDQRESPKEWKNRAILTDATEVRVLETERWVVETFYNGSQD